VGQLGFRSRGYHERKSQQQLLHQQQIQEQRRRQQEQEQSVGAEDADLEIAAGYVGYVGAGTCRRPRQSSRRLALLPGDSATPSARSKFARLQDAVAASQSPSPADVLRQTGSGAMLQVSVAPSSPLPDASLSAEEGAFAEKDEH
jgi:hypothetical protein